MQDITILIIALSLLNIVLRFIGFIIAEERLQKPWTQHLNRYAPSLIFFCLALFSTFGNTLELNEMWKTIPLFVAIISHIISANMIVTLIISMLSYALTANYLLAYLPYP